MRKEGRSFLPAAWEDKEGAGWCTEQHTRRIEERRTISVAEERNEFYMILHQRGAKSRMKNAKKVRSIQLKIFEAWVFF